LDASTRCVPYQIKKLSADSGYKQGNIVMSQNDLPEVKPDLMLNAWGLGIAATGSFAIIAGLVALAMLLSSAVLINLFGH
jgi:hypothetical protein